MNKSRFRRYGIMSILAVLSITMLSCSKDKSDKDASAAEEAEAVVFAVTTVTAPRGELNDYLEFGGDVVAAISHSPDAAGNSAGIGFCGRHSQEGPGNRVCRSFPSRNEL